MLKIPLSNLKTPNESEFQSQLDKLESELSDKEEQLAALETLKKAFSTNGLLAYKIESLVKELELMTNEPYQKVKVSNYN